MVEHSSLGGIPLVFGGNVFGWTIDRDRSFEILDAFFEAGGRMIDTAEGYSSWVQGNKGGESETIIGEWQESRGVRKEVLIGTKTGMGGPPGALKSENVAKALEGSLERLRTDYVDLYYAHRDDFIERRGQSSRAMTPRSRPGRRVNSAHRTTPPSGWPPSSPKPSARESPRSPSCSPNITS
jgi:aryl-alcohol dehydrogenase-like predicted oxidoreductase